MLLNLVLLLIINLLALKLVQYTRVRNISIEVKNQLRNCFVLLTDNNQSDEQKEERAILIGINLFKSIIQLILVLSIFGVCLISIYKWYPDFFSFIFTFSSLTISAAFIGIYFFIRSKFDVPKL
jgi:hypothetical protein